MTTSFSLWFPAIIWKTTHLSHLRLWVYIFWNPLLEKFNFGHYGLCIIWISNHISPHVSPSGGQYYIENSFWILYGTLVTQSSWDFVWAFIARVYEKKDLISSTDGPTAVPVDQNILKRLCLAFICTNTHSIYLQLNMFAYRLCLQKWHDSLPHWSSCSLFVGTTLFFSDHYL